VDNQLPAGLARWLKTRGYDACHALDLGMACSSDLDVFAYAESAERILVSKDEDFLHLTLRSNGARLIWVRLGNCRTAPLPSAFERAWPNIVERMKAGDLILETR
jgi:predicted nuclease of predicted toxin-antitoxin system